ncbi:MAG: DUF2809 domain-containing protein [Bacteroidota bacterium]
MRFFRFNKKYFLLTILLFIIEVLIAVYAHDNFIRPYFGDYLVVMLIYCFWMSFISAPVWIGALITLLFSYAIETLQYFKLVGMLGLQDSKLANTLIGNSFSWNDIVAYTLGVLTILGIEFFFRRPR